MYDKILIFFQSNINTGYNWLSIFQPAGLESFEKTTAALNMWTTVGSSLFWSNKLPHTVEAATAATPLEISVLTVPGGVCALFHISALKLFTG